DFGLGLYGYPATYKTIEWIYNPNYDSNRPNNKSQHTLLFRQLMADADFKREFIDRAAIYMGDFLNSKGTREIWDGMYNLIKTEYPYHRQCVRQWWPSWWQGYTDELNTARQWVVDRTEDFYQQLDDFYQLGTPTPLNINKELGSDDQAKMQFLFNNVPLTKGIFDGKFFLGRNITLKGNSHGDKVVKGWKVITKTASGSNTQTINSSIYSFNMPSCQSLSINAILGDVLKGDVNGDNEVNISDSACLTNYILGKDPNPFILAAADINDDGIINITDVLMLISIVLGNN
ncbi:MAG: dockerin type I repeat-containing protein, partial [Prevotella sp.]|nr:dockerin type I repeat-containing protein [Prevotella sp.]